MFLDTPLCFARFVPFLACDAACLFSATCSKSTCSNWMISGASFADGLRFLSVRAKMSSQIFWNSASTFATYSFVYGACCSLSCFLCCVQFVPVSNLSCRLSFLLSLDNLLDLNLHLMFFVLRNPSLQSTWLLQRSVTVCYSSVVSYPLSTRHLSVPQLQFPLQSLVFSCFLGNLQFLFCCHALMTFSILVSRHRSNFFSRDIHCSPRTSRPAVGTALSVLLILLLLGMLFSPAVGCALLDCC